MPIVEEYKTIIYIYEWWWMIKVYSWDSSVWRYCLSSDNDDKTSTLNYTRYISDLRIKLSSLSTIPFMLINKLWLIMQQWLRYQVPSNNLKIRRWMMSLLFLFHQLLLLSHCHFLQDMYSVDLKIAIKHHWLCKTCMTTIVNWHYSVSSKRVL